MRQTARHHTNHHKAGQNKKGHELGVTIVCRETQLYCQGSASWKVFYKAHLPGPSRGSPPQTHRSEKPSAFRTTFVESFPSQVQGLDANHGHQSTSCISHRGIQRCSRQCKVRLGNMAATLRVVGPVGGRFLPEVSTINRLPRTIHSFSHHHHLGSSPNGPCHTFPVRQHPYSVCT